MPRGEVLIPEKNAAVIARRFGRSGERFLSELPQRVAAIAARWSLVLGQPLPIGIGGYLVSVRMANGTEAVLKVSPTGGEQDEVNELEAYALRRWGGEGAVTLFAADPAAGALLIERCVPGDTIDTLPDDEMVTAGCGLAHKLHRAADAEDGRALPSAVAEAAERAARLNAATGHAMSAQAGRLIARAHAEVTDSGELVVCHGDLNPGNLLAAGRVDWLAVDPLPVRAPRAYDAASLVWSKRPWLLAEPDPAAVLERRIALAAASIGAEQREVRAWTLVRLTGILIDRLAWGGYDEAPFIRIAEFLSQLVDA
jgi:streptomycin 6-kinase